MRYITKDEMIMTLELALKQLKQLPIDKDTKMYSTIDTGGYGDDPQEIIDFDLGFEFEQEDNVLIVSTLLERKLQI